MTREEFENLQIGDYIHDLKVGDEWQVLSYVGSALRCECTKASKTWGKGSITNLPIDVHSHFALGHYPEPTPEQPRQVTVAEAIKQGLKVGDKIWIEFEVMEISNSCVPIKVYNKYRSVGVSLTDLNKIIYAPQPYTPKHRELCAVVTTTGLTTECEVFESNGRLFAISLILGKPDGVFCPEQIDKFLPLTK